MRAFFAGPVDWQDTYILDVLLGGLKDAHTTYPASPLEVVHDDMPVVKAIAEARHSLDTVSMTSRKLKGRGGPGVLFVLGHSRATSFIESGAYDRMRAAWRKGIPIYTVLRAEGANSA